MTDTPPPADPRERRVMALPYPTEQQRLALCEWLNANGINPNSVPLESSFAITEDNGQRVIHYTEFVLTADGHKQVDPEDNTTAWRRKATAPCTVQPPAWLRVPGGLT
jgi:hypothetical protein